MHDLRPLSLFTTVRDATTSIAGRLLAGYGVVMVLLALTWGAGAYSTNQMNARLSHAVEVNDALLSNVTDRVKLLDDEETGLRGYLLTTRLQFLEPYSRAHRLLPPLRTHGAVLANRLPDSLALFRLMTQRARVWEPWARTVLQHPPFNPRAPVAVANQITGKRLFDQFRAASSALVQKIDVNRRHDLDQGRHLQGLLNWLSGLIFFIALLTTIIVGWLTMRAVSLPLGRLRRGADTIASGDLTKIIGAERIREFAGLAQSMGAMRRQLVQAAAHRTQFEEALQ
ncbi:MAG TPA: CHASE3 domain-containing protein, partial [Chloroflexota bacterium]